MGTADSSAVRLRKIVYEMINSLIGALALAALLAWPGAAPPLSQAAGQAFAAPLPPQAMVSGVPRHAQLFNLSCESRSAADLAAYWGATIGEARIRVVLPASDNPHKGFVGDVNDAPGSIPPAGYGVYAEPVAAALRRFGVNAAADYALGLPGLQAEIAAGRPVLVWATYGMRDSPVLTWTSADGITSAIVQYEHTFIAFGYDAEGLYLIDAYDGRVEHSPYAVFDTAWRKLGQMAITVEGLLPAWEDAWLSAGPPCRARTGPGSDRATCRPR